MGRITAFVIAVVAAAIGFAFLATRAQTDRATSLGRTVAPSNARGGLYAPLRALEGDGHASSATSPTTTDLIPSRYPTLVVVRWLPGGREDVEVLDTATGATRQVLVPDVVLFSGNNVSRSDSGIIAFAHYEGQPITWLDPSTGARHDIPGGYDPALGPDGHSLAYWQNTGTSSAAIGVTDLVTGATRSVDISGALGDGYELPVGNGLAWLGPRRLAVVGDHEPPMVVGGAPSAEPPTTAVPHPRPRVLVLDPFAGSPAAVQTVVQGPSTHQWTGIFADGSSLFVVDGPSNGEPSKPGELLEVDMAHPHRPPRPLAAIPPGDQVLAVDRSANQVLVLTPNGSLEFATIDAGRFRQERVITGRFVAATWLAGT